MRWLSSASAGGWKEAGVLGHVAGRQVGVPEKIKSRSWGQDQALVTDLAPFPVKIGGTDPSRLIEAVAALPKVRGNVSPCLRLMQHRPQILARYITGMPDCLFQSKIALHWKMIELWKKDGALRYVVSCPLFLLSQ